ncbi:TPA: DUF1385 domain-containing protein [Candidatus Woesearchaeota archaeon]|nr:hypothetical protein QT06_C0001G1296 [archaeon GW2011_AR15]MBS3104245.1 DUF1385 domain-containing protein [Candidatus Woesearchaeota archaeon]HIH41924.1 DUF1385 domain-containing protein [Candidatus Woesearchaeota archaeon]
MPELTIGGQALIEGVMMRSSDKYALCVRRPDKKISTKIVKIQEPKHWFPKIPVVRGVYRFAETLSIGVSSISYSALESQGEDNQVMSSWEIALTVILSVGMTILLFFAAPLFIARFLAGSTGAALNLIDGIVRIAIFLIYLLLISFIPDIRRIFQYHGAEHKTVYCYENKEKLTVKNVKKYSTLHPRCGTNFILIVFVLSIVFFTFVDAGNYFQRLGIRILLLPVIAGVSYEFLKFAGKHFDNILVKIIISPGLLIQKITTKEPTDDMIEVAIKSLGAALA